MQTGFGAFVSVYLTAERWSQTDIGLVLSVGAAIVLLGQIPGGAAVDAASSPRRITALAVVAVGASAFALAASASAPIVFVARAVQAGASCVLTPAIAAISLGLVGRSAISRRLGRNAAFASIGSAFAAAGMGVCAYWLSNRAAFLLVAGMTAPALLALTRIAAGEIDPIRAHGGIARPEQRSVAAGLLALLEIRPLLIFAGCIVLFQLANAAMLPLAAGLMTLRSSKDAAMLVAVAILGPQLVVALLSPWVGRRAEQWGRRPLLVLCFAALTIRALFFSYSANPTLLMAVQLLDGVCGAVLGVLAPLIVADLAGDTGHFNLAQGAVGCAVGVGAAISTTAAGYVSDRLGGPAAFLAMAAIGLLGLTAARFAMPETRSGAGGGEA